MSIQLDDVWALDPSVALRSEPFGALAYHFGTRKLIFLKTPQLAGLLKTFDGHTTVRDALCSSELPEAQWSAYVDALAGLAESSIISPAPGPREVVA